MDKSVAAESVPTVATQAWELNLSRKTRYPKRTVAMIDDAAFPHFKDSPKQSLAAEGKTVFHVFSDSGVKTYSAATKKLSSYEDRLSRLHAQFRELRGLIEFSARNANEQK